jgi:protein-disulfide isomerase
MKKYFNFRQILVLATALSAFLIIGIGIVYQLIVLPPAKHVETKGSPGVGKKTAVIEMVLFEDFCCAGCRLFHKEVFPRIKEKYINKGVVRFTIVPLAFLPGSKSLANAALEVYKIAPDRFFAYVHELSEETAGAANSRLLRLGKKVGGINLEKLDSCLKIGCHYQELNKNLEAARELMGRNFGTPALYVNGILTSTVSFEAVETRIEQLSRKGRL